MRLRRFLSGPAARVWVTMLVLLVLAGCSSEQYPQTTLDPQTDFTQIIDHVFMSTVRWAIVVFVLVEGALLFAIFKFRGKPTDPEPKQTHGNTTVEIVWTIIPAVILALIAVPTIRGIFSSAEIPEDAVRVQVIGHQWWWEFRYPDHQVVTANEMHIPAGRKIVFFMHTADVLHSFWVPQLAAKRDVFPRRATTLWFTAPEQPGMYPGQCAEFCGIQHGRMGFRVYVDRPEDFDAWVAREQIGSPLVNAGVVGPDIVAPQPADTTLPALARDSLMAKGAALFTSAGCIGCHAMVGTPMAGQMGVMGPNLSHVGSRQTIVANLLVNNEENLARWLRNPQEVKEGTLMKLPRDLTEDEVQLLVDYLLAHE